tara:strand:+ start:794 stop:1024 length:231 start_codon:yes stop_codon:yes gene_type:complete
LDANLLIIENKSSKQGYQINKIIKYGDMKLFSFESLIKINPTNKDKIYAPESPRIICPNRLNNKIIINNDNKLVTK